MTPPPGPSGGRDQRVGAGDVAGPVIAWLGLALVLLARIYRAVLVTLVVAATVPVLWSWSTYVVRSGSMEPLISVGDVVVTQPFTTASPVPVGRVMLFTPPEATDGHENRLHRVVENLGDGTYVTAGDANRHTDTSPVPAGDFHGRAVICVPFVGLPLVWLGDRDLGLLIGWLLITIIALYLSSRPSCHARHRRPVRDDRRVALRTGTGAAATAIVLVGAAVLPMETADAAFSDATVDAANTWRVAVNTSRAVSTIQVYDIPSSTGWYQRASVSVNISATASRGTTVRSITYRLNGGSPVTTKSSSLVLTVGAQGDNVITYFATDSVGAAEATHTTHVRLDNRSPVLTVTSPTGDLTHAQWRAACAGTPGGVCGTVVDPPGSGTGLVEYVLFRSSDARCFNGTTWTSAACQTRVPATLAASTWLATVPDASLPVARTWYTITLYARDVAGNTTNTTRNYSVG